MAEFPDMKGFSHRNLKFVRQWYLFYYQEDTKGKQPVSQVAKQAVAQMAEQPALTHIPWGHNIVIIQKCWTTPQQALFYVQKTIENNWSRSVLTHQIESDLYSRQAKAITNFETTLPAPQSDLAHEIIKDPYTFDFLTLRESHTEKELEDTLTSHISAFLIELGAGFAYLGKQVPLQVGGRDFFVDLLFYHTKLHCHV
ncbi:MAG: DUF1016 domain-containing protein, partial [Planctomycetota bacterium]